MEDNTVVSLYHTLMTGMGRSHFMGDPPATTYFTMVVANTAIVGNRPWNVADPIYRVWFEIDHTKDIVAHNPVLKSLYRKKAPGRELSTPVFIARGNGFRLGCWYSARGSFEFGMREWYPTFEIEYDDACHLENYLDAVHNVLQFFSAAAGFHLIASEIVISGFTGAEAKMLQDEGKSDNQRHGCQYIWSSRHIDKSDLNSHNPSLLLGKKMNYMY